MIKNVLKIFVVWLIFASINYELLVREESQLLNINLDTSVFFPISVFNLEFHAAGLKFGLLFGLGLLLSLKFASRFKLVHLWIIGLFFIVLGNLTQGSIDDGFLKPFYEGKIQYYHDAIKIVDWRQWLASFTEIQESLHTHAQTHPPFAVLLHYAFLRAGSGKLGIIAIAFSFLSSLSIVLMWLILKAIEIPIRQRNMLTILFSVIPAFNIYSCISLDGIILTSSLLFLYGLTQIMKYGLNTQGVLAFLVGFVFTNALSFGGIFLILVALILGVREYLKIKKYNILLLLLIAILLGIILNELSGAYLGYSHFLAFRQASRFENPDGFQAFVAPVNYLFTRIENIAEIALFLSIGCLAVLFTPKRMKLSNFRFINDWNALALSGVFTLLLMFLTGAFRTGETARASLFIYPYLLLFFRNINFSLLSRITILAGMQTIVMQLFGNYFW